jgi:hypothetical protein
MKKNSKPTNSAKETVFVIYTSTPVENALVHKMTLSDKDVKAMDRLVSMYDDKIRQVHIHGNIGDLARLSTDYRGLIKVFAASKKEIIRHSKMLKERRCLICPEFPVEKVEDISFIAAMGIAVDLLYRIDQMDMDTVLRILNYYLHHRPLNIPIEPFHSILMSRLRKEKLSLWNLHLKFPGMLKEYFESIPRNHPGCMSCAHFHFCFSWARYKKDTCDIWKEVLDRLQANARLISMKTA